MIFLPKENFWPGHPRGHGIVCFVGAIGVVLGGLVVKYFGFDVLFAGMSITALICAVGILLKPREVL